MMKMICMASVMLCAAMGSANAASMTYYDDGDALFNGGVIDYGGTGRPASGSAYDGTKYLTVWGDPVRGFEGQANYCRNGNRVSAFVTNDIALNHSADWTITLDVANDKVSPDYGLDMWLVNFDPHNAAYAQGWYPTQTTFWLRYWDQLPSDNARGGFIVSYWLADGSRVDRCRENGWLILDPDPNVTSYQSGSNIVTIEWLSALQKYRWTITNLHGSVSLEVLASELLVHPTETYFMLGNVGGGRTGGATGQGGLSVASGYTIKSLTYAAQPLPPLNIGLRKQLLVDNYVVAEMSNVTRELGQVTKANGGQPLIVADKPWEDTDLFRLGSVYREGGKFKMCYLMSDYYFGYAESEDGLNWTKPNLGFYQYQGSGDNNIVDGTGWTCFPDPHETDPAHKYKSAYGTDSVMAALAHSSDRFQWTPYNNGNPVTGRAADTINQLLWDDYAGVYRLYTRTDYATSEFEVRGTRDMTNPDVKANPTNWTKIREWKFPETTRRQIYALNGWLYEGVHFGLLWCYEWPEDLSEGGYDTYTRHERDIMNFYILTCRGNEMWDTSWVYAGKPLVPRGPSGSFDKDWVQASPNITTWNDKHWIYYSGAKERHNVYKIHSPDQPRWQVSIGLATLRLDGFVYLNAGDTPGTALTKTFISTGDELQINADASGGSALVEILDGNGQPVPGYTASDCDAITTDAIRHLVSWKGRSRLVGLPTGGLRLRFYMTRAKLYSFQFQTAPAATAVASVAAAKALPDSTLISISSGVATGRFVGSFYIEDSDRSSGIRVISPAPVSGGDAVVVTGTLRTTAGEREILARDVRLVGS